MRSSARSERWRTGGDARAWRGASEVGVAGVATGSQQAEAYVDRETLSPARGGGLGAEAPAEAPLGSASAGPVGSLRQTAAVRVLIAIEDRHRVYREAIGEFLRATQPRLEVRLASSRGLHGELRRFGPQIVVHAGPPVPIPDLLPCWVELSLDPSIATVFRTGRIRREVLNPSIKLLMAVIDEAAPACP
jgi:hypothetical protein